MSEFITCTFQNSIKLNMLKSFKICSYFARSCAIKCSSKSQWTFFKAADTLSICCSIQCDRSEQMFCANWFHNCADSVISLCINTDININCKACSMTQCDASVKQIIHSQSSFRNPWAIQTSQKVTQNCSFTVYSYSKNWEFDILIRSRCK